MIGEPQRDAKVEVKPVALLVACAIVGLWLFSLANGYDIGSTIGHAVFGLRD